MTKREKNYYVDDEKFLQHMTEYRKKYLEAIENDLDKPKLSNYAGKCIMDIAYNLARKGNFRNYTYRDEMIEYGIENAIAYAHNFDPDKKKSPFNYFTTIIYYGFLYVLAKEEKNLYIKYKSIENFNMEAALSGEENPETIVQNVGTLEKMYEFIERYEAKIEAKRLKKEEKKNAQV
jgi:hypothetical protein